MKYVAIFFISLGLIACDQKSSTDSTKERAAAEQEANTKVENDNLAQKAQQMEKDLAERHYFYSALEGEYQGNLKVSNENYKIKFVFARSIPPYTGDRIRQLSEIENEINNLFFYIQIIQWHPSDQATAVGCRVSGIRPNRDDGTLTVASAECPNLYTVFIAENLEASVKDKIKEAKQTVEKLKQYQIQSVDFLTGTIQPSSNAGKYSFSVKKLK